MSKFRSNLEMLENESNILLIAAIKSKLSLSIEERINSHENARQLINDLMNAKKELSAGPQKTS